MGCRGKALGDCTYPVMWHLEGKEGWGEGGIKVAWGKTSVGELRAVVTSETGHP